MAADRELGNDDARRVPIVARHRRDLARPRGRGRREDAAPRRARPHDDDDRLIEVGRGRDRHDWRTVPAAPVEPDAIDVTKARDWAKQRYRPLDANENKRLGTHPAGVESETPVLTTRTHVDSRTTELPRVDVSVRPVVDVGPSEVPSEPPRSGKPASLEDALAEALMRAAAAGRWDIVAQLGRELEARRLAAASTPSLQERRDKAAG